MGMPPSERPEEDLHGLFDLLDNFNNECISMRYPDYLKMYVVVKCCFGPVRR
jgi:hypothetical protein